MPSGQKQSRCLLYLTAECILQEENEAKPGTPDERTDHWVVAGSETEARRLIEESHPNRKIARIEQVCASLPETYFALKSSRSICKHSIQLNSRKLLHSSFICSFVLYQRLRLLSLEVHLRHP